jgi:hypothetical protein
MKQKPKVTVRKELGDTGSYGTISTFLQRWKQDQAPATPELAQPCWPRPRHVSN